ncbi:MAG: hypothetical protein K1X94_08080 [Sandaracinaceae bacterium]|nr:hypothetical protein [Sandaracinaceae bacterium]
MKTIHAVLLGSGLALASLSAVPDASAQQAGVFVAGHWETDAGNAAGRGGGHFSIDLSQNGSRVRWVASNGGEYLCSLEGSHCTGTWHGTSGSGWFDVWFSPDGGSFNGSWGYADDRSAPGSWSGRRT